jgi:DNA-binding CsgD family transcriptional regulator
MSSTSSLRLDHPGARIGAWVVFIGVLDAISMATRPVADGRAGAATIVLTIAILSVHASLYVFDERLRVRHGDRAWLVAQAVALFAFSLLDAPIPLTVALFGAAVAYVLTIPAFRSASTLITLGAIVLGAIGTAIVSSIYRGATLALALGAAGLVIHAIRGVIAARGGTASAKAPSFAATPAPTNANGTTLSARELEVLRLAAAGVTSKDIATRLDIAERTIKAHLASAYRKLGVKSRAEAVAVAARLGLLR